MSVVVTLLYSGFAQISGNAVELTRELESRQALRVLLKVVMDDLQSVQYLPNWAKTRPSGLVASIRYEESKPFTWVRFHAAVPTRFYRNLEQGGDPGLHEIAYRIERDRKQDLLTLTRREDFYLDRDLDEGGITLTLAQGITVFKVEFLIPATGTQTRSETWSETWDSADSIDGRSLPPAMRLTIAQVASRGQEFHDSLELHT